MTEAEHLQVDLNLFLENSTHTEFQCIYISSFLKLRKKLKTWNSKDSKKKFKRNLWPHQSFKRFVFLHLQVQLSAALLKMFTAATGCSYSPVPDKFSMTGILELYFAGSGHEKNGWSQQTFTSFHYSEKFTISVMSVDWVAGLPADTSLGGLVGTFSVLQIEEHASVGHRKGLLKERADTYVTSSAWIWAWTFLWAAGWEANLPSRQRLYDL